MKTTAISLFVIVILSMASWGQTPASKPAASQPASAPVYSAWPFDANEAARRQDETAKALSVQKGITLKLDANVAMKLVLIPAGEFVMGSPNTDKALNNDELPQHQVTISKPFYMDVYVVTQEQYAAVVGENPSYFRGATNPVDQVSWDDAVAFCKKLSQKTGRCVHLPTEAQCEYACRATSKARFCYGNDDDDYGQLADYAWHSGNSDKATHPVGQKKPNAFGLFDMHGNVFQWCSDWYDEGCYASGNNTDPQGPASGDERVLRGGNWFYGPRFCRSAFRYGDSPARQSFLIGFRVVVQLDPNPPTTQPARP